MSIAQVNNTISEMNTEYYFKELQSIPIQPWMEDLATLVRIETCANLRTANYLQRIEKLSKKSPFCP